MGLLKTKEQKEIINKLKKQEIKLPDGSLLTIAVKPKFGNKTKAIISWDKSIDDVDFNITVQGQPIRCYQQGIEYNPNTSESFKAEFSVTRKL